VGRDVALSPFLELRRILRNDMSSENHNQLSRAKVSIYENEKDQSTTSAASVPTPVPPVEHDLVPPQGLFSR